MPSEVERAIVGVDQGVQDRLVEAREHEFVQLVEDAEVLKRLPSRPAAPRAPCLRVEPAHKERAGTGERAEDERLFRGDPNAIDGDFALPERVSGSVQSSQKPQQTFTDAPGLSIFALILGSDRFTSHPKNSAAWVSARAVVSRKRSRIPRWPGVIRSSCGGTASKWIGCEMCAACTQIAGVPWEAAWKPHCGAMSL